MKWFKKKKSASTGQEHATSSRSFPAYTPPATNQSQIVARLPAPILQRIFAFVCPHTQDETYESCEQSALEDTCMLCDLRDLAHCAQVSRRWRTLATAVLYHSIRIDPVHYCEREDILAEKRKRRSFMNRNAEPEDTAAARLKFLARTLRENQGTLAINVQFLKTPYMTRETCKPDLARTVAVCPNLRYVDLPEGFFMDDPSCNTLKQEVQARCPDIRKMSYMGGAERSLEMLADGIVWRNLEVLELSKLNMDSNIMRRALGSLPHIHALKVTDMRAFHDDLFRHSDILLPFPALTELIFENTPNITADGLTSYLFRSDTQDALKTLSLTMTGIQPGTLHQILAVAPALQHLSLIESVTTSFPASNNIPPLQSKSLQVFHYEITSVTSANSYANTTSSYYAYLTRSLLSGGLPNLKELYVRDPDFPESLIDFRPPAAPFMSDPDNFVPPKSPQSPFAQSPNSPNSLNRFSSNNPFAKMQSGPGLNQELQVYSKGLDEMEWNFSRVQPPGRGRRGSATAPRPVSSYGLSESMGKGWGQQAGARKSIIVGCLTEAVFYGPSFQADACFQITKLFEPFRWLRWTVLEDTGRKRTPPPRPIYFSPTNPIPTPYNASRPQPRPGFVSRMLAKISSWIRSVMKWAQKNPIKAGLATFIPILAGAGMVRAGKALGLGKAFSGLTGVLGMVGGGLMEGMGGGKPPGSGKEGLKGMEGKGGGIAKGLEKEVEKEKKEWGWGMDHFVGFGGTKAGPLDGIMKVLLMGV
ncbi:hypothetical protein EG329_001507 [Mollisiaceae sp. DMI_Dod_QoI]|nr:hypothetical protein EG329_001507 [Helotiales sp. DMI_Dod_QoI]